MVNTLNSLLLKSTFSQAYLSGYSGDALELEMSRQRNLFSKALGITLETTMSSTTTTTTRMPTPPPGMELPSESNGKSKSE